MSQTTSIETILLDLMHSQEALRLELQRVASLHEVQARELSDLKKRLSANSETTYTLATLRLPSGLMPTSRRPEDADNLNAVFRDMDGAFHPKRNSYLPQSAYVLYRQLQGFDMSCQRVAVITTANTELSEILAVTNSPSAVEFRVHGVDGPLQAIEYKRDSSPTTRWLPGSIQTLPFHIDFCDTLWIPNPFLASLILQCRGVFEGFAERVRKNVFFTLNTKDWKEHDARTIAHAAGFIELSRMFVSETQSYITRFHETHGYYPLTGAPEGLNTTVLYLLASKIPTPAFSLNSADEASHE